MVTLIGIDLGTTGVRVGVYNKRGEVLATGLATAATFAFLFSWPEFLIPLLLTPSESTMPLTVFAAYFSNQYGISWGPLSAAATVIAVPVILIAIIIQKYIVRGLTLGFIR